ncbi:DUF4350 domain-containing protein [Aridibaculum aurantiacum]|uniref:DUF4350 domain-containing protein n=1 Tax=Aridibaculum aurantiacum TaxID=2810307 RepID=UPI001A974655|nr:DUF4350 domain-containing protein [Aridibaculum aurantiacum]
MRAYKSFILIFIAVLTLYIIAEVNKPKPVDWRVTLSKTDKNPFGCSIFFDRLKDVFPGAAVQSYRMPVYNQLNNFDGYNNAYLLVSESLPVSDTDVEEMLEFVSQGNYVLASASNLSKSLLDTLKLDTEQFLTAFSADSATINFTDPAIRSAKDYSLRRNTLNEYFSKIDSAGSAILGVNNKGQANLVRIPYGEGFFLVHANPLVFSNYFILHKDNAAYTATVLSYLPATVERIMWDEYYNLGPLGAATPLRFFLSNDYLRWALRLSLIGMLLYVLFEMKRRQRIIPVIAPLRNSTVHFIKTIATVFLQQKDNRSLAGKKITYFLEFVRNRYFIATNHLNEEFVELLSRKSGVSKEETNHLVQLIYSVQQAEQVPDNYLLVLNNKIDQFYKQVQ